MNDLLRNLDEAQSLLYHDYAHITQRVSQLSDTITRYAAQNSSVYSAAPLPISKEELYNKEAWYVNDVPSFDNRTNGTTTAKPFQYRIWSDVYKPIEQTHHYKAILDEFGLQSPLKILYCWLDPHKPRHITDVTNVFRTDDIIMSHGLGKEAEIHRVLAGQSYYTDNHGFYERLLDYAVAHKVDVILAQGATIASLAWHATRLQFTDKICRLLSNTGSKLNIADAQSLKSAGLIDDWCDHMRCWDGGATFMTCKHYTYHLQDALSYTYELDGKLISTDYYSLPSPFVNYWNGDYCTIGADYQRCQCGRAYRPFVMGRTRDMLIQNRDTGSTRNALMAAEGGHKIKRIEGYGKKLLIVLHSHLKLTEAAALRAAVRSFAIQFVVEQSDPISHCGTSAATNQ